MPVSTSLKTGRGRFRCTVCKESFQLDRFVPFVTESAPRYCPLCKGDIEKIMSFTNRWQEFAIDGGWDPEQWQIIEDLYKLWDPTAGDPISFIDHIRNFVKEVEASE